ncbi:hypothetical protein Nepgr_031387 [Nepenthes gracilis]|uniref:Uncharacterized protein n=1 Tax=Nepenthes gracilis TaxID=150966 RepID=A0AAD3TI10_NEPGR|nr:hypothetical protein Nepgr_031387 [Nepenthes gracilis]
MRLHYHSCSLSLTTQPNLIFRTQTSDSFSFSSSPPTYSFSSAAASHRMMVEFKTLGGCKLGISRYPDFEYNAEGGIGTGSCRMLNSEDDDDDESVGEILVGFDVERLYIPPLTAATTKFLGFPLPAFLKIDIVPQLFHGRIHNQSGKVDLEFKAEFWFSIGSIYRAPPLLVATTLTTEESKGRTRGGRGRRLDKDGKCRLIGVAAVDRIDDDFMNSFLGLPTECLADLSATISFAAEYS